MVNPSGTITFNGITDSEMVKIWEFKANNEGAFTFSPQHFQITQNQRPTSYGNVTFQWNGERGLVVMHEIVGYLLKKEEKAEAVGQ